MLETILYTCEYCKKQYSSRDDCEKCEKSHSHNTALHNKLTSILKDTNVFYCYKGDIGVIYIYKVDQICEDQSPECKLQITGIEIRLNRVFDWHHVGRLDSYRATYFVENIETEFWKPLKRNSKVFKELITIFKSKALINSVAEKEEIFVKYNVLKSVSKTDIIKEFNNLFNRDSLDQSIKNKKSNKRNR